MNNCIFYGCVTNCKLDELSTAKRLVFDLVIVNSRKTKQDKLVKDKVVLPCEAWDSAADVIETYCKERFIIVRASVKTADNRLLFRVNEFSVPERN